MQEWYEVTECFTSVDAKDINNYMRLENGLRVKSDFSQENFLQMVAFEKPTRSFQRQVADNVTNAILKKIQKATYREMVDDYGYGTLIVGLPLWFATPPLNPQRAENVLDDFVTRTIASIGVVHPNRY